MKPFHLNGNRKRVLGWGCFAALLLMGCDTRPPLNAEDLSRPPILELSVGVSSLLADKDTSLEVKILLATAAHGTLMSKRIDFTAQVGFLRDTVTTNDSGRASLYYYNKPRAKAITEVLIDTLIGTFVYGDGKEIHDTLEIRLLPGKPTTGGAETLVGSIELGTSRTSVQVKGNGNNDQALITARVYDMNKNIIRDGTQVSFAVLKGPGGGEALAGGASSEIAATVNGVASVTFHGGTKIGVIEIQASCGGQTTRQALLTVTSGPPQHINIVAHKDETQTAGNRWHMQVVAQLTDAYDNPVKDSVVVLFSVKPRLSDPGSVSIIGSGFTGNRLCLTCDTALGSAYTSVSYRSEAIFDTLEVTAETSNPLEALKSTFRFQLPLQGTTLRANYYGGPVFAPSNQVIDTVQIVGDLRDGFGWPVPGAKLCIATDGGTALNKCLITNTQGQALFGLTMTLRDQTTAASSRLVNVKLVEQSTGTEAATTFTTIFK